MKAAVCSLLLAVIVSPAFSLSEGAHYPCEDDLIEVMFQHSARMSLQEDILADLSGLESADGLESVLAVTDSWTWERLSHLGEEQLDAMEAGGEARTGEDLYNLNNILRLRFTGDIGVWELCEMLEELPGIMSAIPVPLPQPLPQPPPYQGAQGYLNPASSTPTGIDALYAWTQGGGTGTGSIVCDLEYSWNYNHADITKAVGSQINSNVADPFSDNNHGTAVLGELVSDQNGWGTTGICYGAGLYTCGTYYGLPNPNWNIAGAIMVAINNLSAGDVILLEQQWEYVPGSNDFIPIEWWGSYTPGAQTFNVVYAAIQTAVANGIHVVEAGGNAVNGGGVNMDNMNWFGDSGAMIVGGGGAYTGGTWPGGDLQRLWYSNYGSRFDLHAWGEDVVTTGYGYLYSSMGVNYYYTNSFSGTSSASPMVAGAAACCVGYWVANGNPASTLTPQLLRFALNLTGTPQITPPSGSIGPRPDLQGAFAYLFSVGIAGEESEETGAETSLAVTPNPSWGAVTFTLSNPGAVLDGTVRIFDLAGRMAGAVDLPSGTAGDWAVTQWNPESAGVGVYFAVAVTGSGPVVSRFAIID